MAADKLKTDKWVITAVNQLTGERERISKPHSRWKTEQLLVKAQRDVARHRTKPCYRLHRMEMVEPEEGNLEFQPVV